MTWKPSPRAEVNSLTLPLDPRQGFLLSHLDGTLDVPTLATLMNLDEDQTAVLLDDLVALGAVARETPRAMPPPRLCRGLRLLEGARLGFSCAAVPRLCLEGKKTLDLYPETSVERLRSKAWLKGVVEE